MFKEAGRERSVWAEKKLKGDPEPPRTDPKYSEKYPNWVNKHQCTKMRMGNSGLVMEWTGPPPERA